MVKDDFSQVHAKNLKIFIVADTSEAMRGRAIDALNDTGRSILAMLKEIDEEMFDAELRMNVLKIGSEPEWLAARVDDTPCMGYVQDFIWKDLEVEGTPALGAALRELNRQLSHDKLMHSKAGNWTPIILFLSSGGAADDWEAALAELNENKWYQHAVKCAVAVGEAPDFGVLSQIVGNPEAVIFPDSWQSIRPLIGVFAMQETDDEESIIDVYPSSNTVFRETDNEIQSPRSLLVKKPNLDVVFVLDGSDAMEGGLATAMNAMTHIVVDMLSLGLKGNVNSLRFGAIRFGDGAKWLTCDLWDNVELENDDRFRRPSISAGGKASLGEALRVLNEEYHAIRTRGILPYDTDLAPILIFMGSGQADDDWEPALAELKEKPWFQKAFKIAITFGSISNTFVLHRFTEDPDTVLSADKAMENDLCALKKLFGIEQSSSPLFDPTPPWDFEEYD